MTDVNFDETAERFIKNIGVKLVKPEPIAVTKIEPVAQPQALVEQKPVDKDAEMHRRYLDEIDGIATLEKELSDEDEAVAVVNWICVNRDGYVSHRHVVDGLKALQLGEFKPVIVARGTTSSAPHKQDVAQPVVAAQPTPATTLPDLEAGLPPLPQWVIQKLGSNKLRTRQDVHTVPSWLFSEIYRGVHGAAFKARIDAIGRR